MLFMVTALTASLVTLAAQSEMTGRDFQLGFARKNSDSLAGDVAKTFYRLIITFRVPPLGMRRFDAWIL